MTSQAKIAANRRNGCKSRGPQSVAGKTCASRNALRHGLAAINRHNPALFPDIERIAKAICDHKDPLLFEQALIIAESEFILICVRAERVAAIERMRDPTAISLAKPKDILASARAKFSAAKLSYERLVNAKANTGQVQNKEASGVAQNAKRNSISNVSEPISQPNRTELYDEFSAMRRALPELDRLMRYERRAWSRRKRAIRTFMEIRLASRDCKHMHQISTGDRKG